jgi:hypothetical protein
MKAEELAVFPKSCCCNIAISLIDRGDLFASEGGRETGFAETSPGGFPQADFWSPPWSTSGLASHRLGVAVLDPVKDL